MSHVPPSTNGTNNQPGTDRDGVGMGRDVRGAGSGRPASAGTSDRQSAPWPPSGSILARAQPPTKVTVFGSGSFGTALAALLARNGHEVSMLTRQPTVVESVAKDHKNPHCPFPDMPLPFNLRATTDAAASLAGTALIVHTIPVQASESFLRNLKDLIPVDVPIVCCSKGLHTESLSMMSQLVPLALGRENQPFAVLSGPTFAKELVLGFPTGALVACENKELGRKIADLFSSPTFKVFTSMDVVGVEVAGALKNVFGIAAGISEGLGLGYNSLALLCTRAVAEMNYLAKALGSTETTLAGLAGVGDLMLTCWGSLSRNRTVGVRLGRGEKIGDIMASMTETAEGVATAPAALALARKMGVDVPIVEAVVSVLEGRAEPLHATMTLLSINTGREKIL